jgi:GTP-binding protein
MEIRNIAIIAHVDHGKTTLTDALMRQTGMVTDESSMDSNTLEQERGITIYSKNASLNYRDTKINIVDTPGHADFGSEVERVLRAIDSVVLVVDAQEGPMPQTRFVLKKSLELGLLPVVVLNKIDKPAARPKEVVEMVYELFLDLGANDEQLNFTTVYTNAKEGFAKLEMENESTDLSPLLDTILKEVAPASKGVEDDQLPLKIQPFNLAYDNFLGRLAIARVYQGSIKTGSPVFVKKPDGSASKGKLIKLFTFHGIERQEVAEVFSGDIVMLAGLPDVYIGHTICDSPETEALPDIKIDQPTVTVNFLVNDSPFGGREGKFVTNLQIRERLTKELEVNVGLKIDLSSSDSYAVSGRGELHIAVFLENMRREGYEIQVSQPRVIIKEENGKKFEPFEEVFVDIPQEYSGAIIEKMGKRKGLMTQMKQVNGLVRLVFETPTRGLLGYRGQFIVDTRGEGILSSRFLEFRPYAGEIKKKETGSMVSMANGKALGFALDNLQNRGVLYIGAGIQVYEGMVIGNTSKGEDIAVNPTKGKQLTNTRASSSDDAIELIPPMNLTIERGLEIMAADEYLEITPLNVRLRKKYLSEKDRVRSKRGGSRG